MTSSAPAKPEKSYLSAAVESISPWTSRSSTPTPASQGTTEGGAKAQQGLDHSVTLHHGIPFRRYPKDCPPLETRWFYAVDAPKRKPQLLKETPKDQKPLPPPKKFAPFSAHDSASVETAYQTLLEQDEQAKDTRGAGRPDLTDTAPTTNKENTSINEAGQDLQQGGRVKVPVNEDFLFDVDVEKRELAPVYWLGPIYGVRRGSWFYQESSGLRPCEENLAMQLEEGYLKVKPFRFSRTAATAATGDVSGRATAQPSGGAVSRPTTPRPSTERDDHSGDEKLTLQGEAPIEKVDVLAPVAAIEPHTYRLFGPYINSVVTYQDESVAWLASDGILSRVSSTVYQRFAGGSYFGGVKVVRGYKDASKATKSSETKSDRPSTPARSDATATEGETPLAGAITPKDVKRRSTTQQTPSAVTEADAADIKSGQSSLEDSALKQQLSSLVTESVDSGTSEEALRKREEKEIQNDYVDHENEDQSREIEHLILVTHGIGQRLGIRTESVNFVHDVNVLRQTLKSVYLDSADLQALNSEMGKLPKNCRVQVLPVFWRHELEFPRRHPKQSRREVDIGDEAHEPVYPTLEDITLEGVPFVRSLISDLALDILLYQSSYREHICRIVLRECNRIHKLFVERNPYFRGKVSLVGHSLGSAILFDILCRQKASDSATAGSSKYSKYYFPRQTVPPARAGGDDLALNFPVEDLYCLGSPIGLFQMLKGRTIGARHHSGAPPAESPLDPDSVDDPFLAASAPPPHSSRDENAFAVSSPKCVQLYNVFYPSDPISYRLEPLIAPAMSSLKPQNLPYTKKGLFGASAAQGLTGIGAKVGQSVSELWSSFSAGIANSVLTRSLGLTGDEIASMTIPPTQLSPGAGTNIVAGRVIPVKPSLVRNDTNERQIQLAEDTAAADLQGGGVQVPTLIDSEIETLYSGFQKRGSTEREETVGSSTRSDAEAGSGRNLRKEEMKVRALNQNGRVDYSIQESALDFNPINTIASHLNYWSDEDVSHFMMSQLLSRNRNQKRRTTQRL